MNLSKVTIISLMIVSISQAKVSGEEVFKEYCWGCHHQTSQAFGPSFEYIADHRDRATIKAQIVAPKQVYKSLGYKRNSMPSFSDLNASELDAITDYIMSFKTDKRK